MTLGNSTTSSQSRRRVIIAGGGIAGAEAALTLALGLPDADVTLIGRWPSLRLLPDLVYVPFGVSPRRIDLPLSSLVPHGVRVITAEVDSVDIERKRLFTSVGELDFDALVAAPGAAAASRGMSLRTLDDALRIRESLRALLREARDGFQRTITIRAGSDDSWTAPACELAILMGAWIRSHRLEDRVATLLAETDGEVFEWFGTEANDAVGAALRRARVKAATHVPDGRLDALDGDLVIDVGLLEPRTLMGLPGRTPSGWYDIDEHCAVAKDIFVIGDATTIPFRAGFASAWESRRVLAALGGDVASIGPVIDGIPSGAVEYQMDLADSVMRVRVAAAEHLAHPFLGHDTDVEVIAGGRPDKLRGLLLHDRVLRYHATEHDAALAYRDLLRAQIT